MGSRRTPFWSTNPARSSSSRSARKGCGGNARRISGFKSNRSTHRKSEGPARGGFGKRMGSRGTPFWSTNPAEVLREAALGSAWEAGARHFGQRTRRRALAAGPLERGAAAMLAAFPGSRATDRPTGESEVLAAARGGASAQRARGCASVLMARTRLSPADRSLTPGEYFD